VEPYPQSPTDLVIGPRENRPTATARDARGALPYFWLRALEAGPVWVGLASFGL
jgi:hypothetical protein